MVVLTSIPFFACYNWIGISRPKLFLVSFKDALLLPGVHNDGQIIIGCLGNSRYSYFGLGIGLGIHHSDDNVVCKQRTSWLLTFDNWSPLDDERRLVTRFLWHLLLTFWSKVSVSWNRRINFGGDWGSSGPNDWIEKGDFEVQSGHEQIDGFIQVVPRAQTKLISQSYWGHPFLP